jgi:hypothetical protein
LQFCTRPSKTSKAQKENLIMHHNKREKLETLDPNTLSICTQLQGITANSCIFTATTFLLRKN